MALAIATLLAGGLAQRSLAQSNAAETEAWELVRDSGDPGIFERFLDRYPNGAHAADARAKLDALNDSGDDLTVAPTPAPAAVTPAPPINDIVLKVQQELQRAGCSPGTPDGDWGNRSRSALARFRDATGASVSGEPSATMLTVLQAHPGRVCGASSTTADRPATEQPAPSTRPTLDGNWSYGTTCKDGERYEGQLVFAGSGGSFYGNTSGVRGVLSEVTMSGRRFSFTMTYKLLGTQWERWSGNMNAAGTSIIGNLVDSWDDACSFTATRQ